MTRDPDTRNALVPFELIKRELGISRWTLNRRITEAGIETYRDKTGGRSIRYADLVDKLLSAP